MTADHALVTWNPSKTNLIDLEQSAELQISLQLLFLTTHKPMAVSQSTSMIVPLSTPDISGLAAVKITEVCCTVIERSPSYFSPNLAGALITSGIVLTTRWWACLKRSDVGPETKESVKKIHERNRAAVEELARRWPPAGRMAYVLFSSVFYFLMLSNLRPSTLWL